MSQDLVSVRHQGTYQVWGMDFEPVNALGPHLLDALEQTLEAALDDTEVSAVVLTSQLRVFSAGADANWMRDIVETAGAPHVVDEFKRAMDRFRRLCARIRASEVLFIAALNGHALAGGLELAAACDLRFAADHDRIRLGATEMRLFGVLPSGGGGTQYLSRLLGPAATLNFILEAEPCSPRVALQVGLVQRVYPPDELIHETEAFAARISARAGRFGIGAAKRAILTGVELPLHEALELDSAVHWDAMRRGGFIEGVEAFVAEFGGAT